MVYVRVGINSTSTPFWLEKAKKGEDTVNLEQDSRMEIEAAGNEHARRYGPFVCTPGLKAAMHE
eukprot:3928416-Rhodomonas_salina.1